MAVLNETLINENLTVNGDINCNSLITQNKTINGAINELKTNLYIKNVSEKTIDEIATSSDENVCSFYYGENIYGVSNLVTPNKIWIQVLKQDYANLKVIVYDVNSERIMSISKMNNTYTTWHDLYNSSHNVFENSNINDALLVSLTNPYSPYNQPFTFDSSVATKNIPPDFAWGFREVFFISQNAVIVRLTGLNVDGITNMIMTNIYNHNDWTGWKKF